ncbi:hypothetical protein P278_29700 [Zhouia amylolytica AD3]|uniref:Uncharacterized protein n=1 Tax=Zhouia amylolytica AD3 TaxID=1286632 RepID=W2UL48_9FLAO|nr:hypothetical protein P278_29700 [Zhouia amylolytica AD3]
MILYGFQVGNMFRSIVALLIILILGFNVITFFNKKQE